MRREFNVLALIKGEDRYVLVYEDAARDEALDTIRHWAASPELSFTWFDAAVLSEKAKQQCAPLESVHQRSPSRGAWRQG